MLQTLLYFFVLFSSIFAWAEEKPHVNPRQAKELVHFDFRGLRMGDPPPANVSLIQGCDITPPPEHMECIDPVDLIGTMPVSVAYTFTHGQFSGLMIVFKSEEFSSLVGAFSEKLSKPHLRRSESIQTRGGLKVTNEIVTWHTDGGDLTIKKYSTDIVKGLATIFSDKGKGSLKKHYNEEAKKAAKDL